jgi:N-acylneuraminate cytidylyltransferase
MNTVAIIPAHKWSKWIKNKNFELINWKPLIHYTIESAIKSNIFSKICIATDYDGALFKQFNIEILTLPRNLVKDDSKMSDVVLFVLNNYIKRWVDFDLFTLLQPTSPLRTERHIIKAFKEFNFKKFNSLVSFVKSKKHPYKSFLYNKWKIKSLFWNEYVSLPRQMLPEVIEQNWAIYITNIYRFLKEKSFFIEPVYPFVMDEASSLDIDSEIDLHLFNKIF